MSYYQRIRDLREDKDLNQAEVAQDLNMHKTTYCRYEQGISTPPLDIAVMIAKYYNVSIDYIAGITNDKGGKHQVSREEAEILSKYNDLSERRKGRIIQLLEMLTEEQRQEQKQP